MVIYMRWSESFWESVDPFHLVLIHTGIPLHVSDLSKPLMAIGSSEIRNFTAGCILINQNRPTHTLALSFSFGMEPNNGAHSTVVFQSLATFLGLLYISLNSIYCEAV